MQQPGCVADADTTPNTHRSMRKSAATPRRHAHAAVDQFDRCDRPNRIDHSGRTRARAHMDRRRLAGNRQAPGPRSTFDRLTHPTPITPNQSTGGTIPAAARPRRRGGAGPPAPCCSCSCSCFHQAARRRRRRTPARAHSLLAVAPTLLPLLLVLLLGSAAALGMASVDQGANGASSSGSSVSGSSGGPRRRTLRLLIDDVGGGGSGSGSTGGLRRLSVQAGSLVRALIDGADRY